MQRHKTTLVAEHIKAAVLMAIGRMKMNSPLFYVRAGKLFEAFTEAMPWGECSLVVRQTAIGLECCIEVIIIRRVWRQYFCGTELTNWNEDYAIHVGQSYARQAQDQLRDEITLERKRITTPSSTKGK